MGGTSTALPSLSDLHRERKALVVADMVESVRLIREHEADVIDRWRHFVHEVQSQLLPLRGGRLVKSLGDGLLLEFDLVPSAAAAAIDLQRRIAAYNVRRAPDEHMQLRVGMHVADVVIDELDIYGDGVNLAARLATLAAPGEVVISAEVRDLLVPGVDADVLDLGECYVKHVDRPLRAFRLGPPPAPLQPESLGERRPTEMRPGVAVIPFECANGGDPGDLFGEALADEVISLLARTAELHVISGLSTRGLKGRRLTAAEIAAHLGTAYVLSGRYRQAGERVRLSVELADVRSGSVLWAEGFDAGLAEAFDAEDSLAAGIVAAMGRTILTRELELAATQPMPALESYTLLFGAISLMHRQTPREFERARQLLEHLADRQGRRGEAHAWLAKWHVLRVVQGWAADPRVEAAAAMDRVRRALDAKPGNSLALAIGGQVHGYLRRDQDTAGRMYEDALAINPNEPLAWLFSATRHAYRGEGSQARAASDKALRLSPLDPLKYYFDSLASTAVLADGDWARSVELGRRSIRANRTHASTWRTLAYALVMLDRVDEARDAVRELRSIEPTYTLRSFRERFPGREGPLAEPWAQALAEAGLPQ